MASVLEKTENTRCGVFLEVVSTSTFMTSDVKYNEHRIVCKCAIETEIRWFEYLILNMQNWKYAGFGWVPILHASNRITCTVFGSKFGI